MEKSYATPRGAYFSLHLWALAPIFVLMALAFYIPPADRALQNYAEAREEALLVIAQARASAADMDEALDTLHALDHGFLERLKPHRAQRVAGIWVPVALALVSLLGSAVVLRRITRDWVEPLESLGARLRDGSAASLSSEGGRSSSLAVRRLSAGLGEIARKNEARGSADTAGAGDAAIAPRTIVTLLGELSEPAWILSASDVLVAANNAGLRALANSAGGATSGELRRHFSVLVAELLQAGQPAGAPREHRGAVLSSALESRQRLVVDILVPNELWLVRLADSLEVS